MSKAYDHVEWIFLHEVMAKLGFGNIWIETSMSCVSTTTFSMLINGHKYEIFKIGACAKAVPCRPTFFLLCSEGLSILINEAERQGKIHGLSISRSTPSISYLLFANNRLIFS